jgi:hypothetical protein
MCLAVLVSVFGSRWAFADEPATAAPEPSVPSPAEAPSDPAPAPLASANTSAPNPATDPSVLPPDTTPLAPFPVGVIDEPGALKIRPIGYIEAYYAWNFNRPANGITNYRGFDNRHNTITVQTAALGASFEKGPIGGKLLLQVGSAPSTYYARSEPTLNGTSAANGSSPDLWKYIQEAYATYKAPLGRGILFNVGIMTSPIGMKALAVHDRWNWSGSNLFFALPYYHTGLRATYELTDRLSVTAAVMNGWNNVVDNNDGKSVEAHVKYSVPDKATLQILYFGGVERPSNAPEGQYWRNTFDAVGELDVTSWLQLAAQADAGFEPNRFGTATWYAGAAAARVKICKCLYFVVRGDRFYEHLASDESGHVSTPIFWNGVKWVSSGTATLDFRPHDNISIRAEFRHDQADGLLYFTGNTVIGDGSAASPYAPNARTQETILFGATAWF